MPTDGPLKRFKRHEKPGDKFYVKLAGTNTLRELLEVEEDRVKRRKNYVLGEERLELPSNNGLNNP